MDDFYKRFEDKYRGGRDLIRSRLKVYLPFIEPLKETYSSAQIVDLGCGRGEWLELLRENGFKAQGVDLDSGMLQYCHDLNLDVKEIDAIDYLKLMDDETCVVVSGFHIAEHITFDQLKELVAEAYRVLRPGGLLILETPNPENIVVGTANFYLDPTHQRPIPPELLSFLPEYQGFFRTKILRLQGEANLDSKENIDLITVLSGVSPDCAIVAQKKGPEVLLDKFSLPFDKTYGVNLNDLAQRYSAQFSQLQTVTDEKLASIAQKADETASQLNEQVEVAQVKLNDLHQQLIQEASKGAAEQARAEELKLQLSTKNKKIERLENERKELQACSDEKLASITQKADETASQLSQITNECEEARAKVDELNGLSHHWWMTAEASNQDLRSVYASRSWRITWPLRKLSQFIKWLFCIPVRFSFWVAFLPKRSVRWLTVKVMAFVIKYPSIKHALVPWVKRSEWFNTKLRLLALARGFNVAQPGEMQTVRDKCDSGEVGDASEASFVVETAERVSQSIMPEGLNSGLRSPLEKWFR